MEMDELLSKISVSPGAVQDGVIAEGVPGSIERQGPVIALFDFDGTLVESDSFLPFLGFVAGWPRTVFALLEALYLFAQRRLKDKDDPLTKDPRTFIKDFLLRKLLTGRLVADLQPSVSRLLGWRRWKDSVRATLLQHKTLGHHIVIASGGLDLYLPGLLKDLPYDALICTDVGVDAGRVTGEMVSGNCVRDRKAERVAAYMAANGPYVESWGYGNLPHDLPMLQLVKHRIII